MTTQLREDLGAVGTLLVGPRDRGTSLGFAPTVDSPSEALQ